MTGPERRILRRLAIIFPIVLLIGTGWGIASGQIFGLSPQLLIVNTAVGLVLAWAAVRLAGDGRDDRPGGG